MGPKGPMGDPHWLPAGKCGGGPFPHAQVVGDVGPSLALLGDRLEGKLQTAAALLPLRKEILARITTPGPEDRNPPAHRARRRQVMPEDGIVTLDNGTYKIWFARNYRTRVANTLLPDNALATMGAGLPSIEEMKAVFAKQQG